MRRLVPRLRLVGLEPAELLSESWLHGSRGRRVRAVAGCDPLQGPLPGGRGYAEVLVLPLSVRESMPAPAAAEALSALDAAATASTPEVAAQSVAPDDKKPAAFLRGFQGIRISFDVNAHGEQGQGGNLERVAAAWTEQCAVVAFSRVRTCDRCDGANQRAPPARK